MLNSIANFFRRLKQTLLKFNPLASPFPVVTFPKRTWSKFLFTYGPKLRISGGTPVGLAESGNAIIRLNRSGPLGSIGSLIHVPEDGIIYKDVVRYGYWEPAESLFLAHGIQEVPSTQHSKTALIDIGANSGLITRQSLNLADTDCDVVLFEPLQKHTAAIEFNLQPHSIRHHIRIEQVGLSDENSVAKLFTDLSNRGNSSVFKAAVADSSHEITDITLVSTKDYFETKLSEYSHFVIKSDTQGLDASILSRIPTSMWAKVQRAVIEVWAIPEIGAADVDALIPALEGFPMISWAVDGKITLDVSKIREFWLSQSGDSRNLFLSR